ALAAGVLARYINVWKLTLAGSVVSAMSVSLCYFANGIPYLIVFYGILQGRFRDGLGNYKGLFWLLGTLSACNVVLWCVLCLRERRRCNESNLNKRQPKKHPQA
ncbi:unnamed protein product, partial [Ixodes persulcatus]